jgi:hypothetical protein
VPHRHPAPQPAFEGIQAASDRGNPAALVLFLFDLLYLDGEVISSAPLLERKERLRGLLSNAGSPLQYSDHQSGAARSSMPGPASCRLRVSSPNAQTHLSRPAIGAYWSRSNA